jgi:hypothetical protein
MSDDATVEFVTYTEWPQNSPDLKPLDVMFGTNLHSVQTPEETVPVSAVTAKANCKCATSRIASYHTVSHIPKEKVG